jgi:hypothetical protein
MSTDNFLGKNGRNYKKYSPGADEPTLYIVIYIFRKPKKRIISSNGAILSEIWPILKFVKKLGKSKSLNRSYLA